MVFVGRGIDMQLDSIGKIYIVLSSNATFVKFNIFPSDELKKKMAIGTVAMTEDEAMRLFAGLRAHFEKTDLPDYVEVKDLRGMQRVNDAFRVKKEESKTIPISAEEIQKQNMAADGRLQPQELGEIAEIKKKER